MTEVLGVRLEAAHLDQMAAHAEACYPDEACGVVLGAGGVAREVHPMENVQNRYHQRDPARFVRTARHAFRLDDLAHMRLIDEADARGLAELVLYHSHADCGAYFSPEDRAMAVVDGMEILPGVLNVVISVRAGERADAAGFRFDGTRFEEARLPLSPTHGLPDLSARAMAGLEAARPIKPVGGRLEPRVVTPSEQAMLSSRGAPRVPLSESQRALVRLFAAGALSPLSGFNTRVGPWPQAFLEEELESGELTWQGEPIAFAEGGSLFVYPQHMLPEAADVRAEVLRRAAGAVTASVEGQQMILRVGSELLFRIPVPFSAAFALAACAQNYGATEIVLDRDLAADVSLRTLEIAVQTRS